MQVKHRVLVYYLMIVSFVPPEANVSKPINVFVMPIILVSYVTLPHVLARIPMILWYVQDLVHVSPMTVAPAQWVTPVQIAVSGSMVKHTPSEVIQTDNSVLTILLLERVGREYLHHCPMAIM